MGSRQIKRRPLRKIPIGDMDAWIILWSRAIKAPGFNSAALSEAYTKVDCLWAKHETLEQDTVKFSEVQIKNASTDRFVFRFIPGVTSETVLEWDGQYFEIQDTNIYEGRKDFLQAKCKLRGSKTLITNT